MLLLNQSKLKVDVKASIHTYFEHSLCELTLQHFIVGNHILNRHMIPLGDGCLLPVKLGAFSMVYFSPHVHLHITKHDLHGCAQSRQK